MTNPLNATEIELLQGQLDQAIEYWRGGDAKLQRLGLERKSVEEQMAYQEERIENLEIELEKLLEQENPGSSTKRYSQPRSSSE